MHLDWGLQWAMPLSGANSMSRGPASTLGSLSPIAPTSWVEKAGGCGVNSSTSAGWEQFERPQALFVWKIPYHSSPTSGLRSLPKKIKGLFLFQAHCLTKTLLHTLWWAGFYLRLLEFTISLSALSFSPSSNPLLSSALSVEGHAWLPSSPSADALLTFLSFPLTLAPHSASSGLSLSFVPFTINVLHSSAPSSPSQAPSTLLN